jgi:hypothetical protein
MFNVHGERKDKAWMGRVNKTREAHDIAQRNVMVVKKTKRKSRKVSSRNKKLLEMKEYEYFRK